MTTDATDCGCCRGTAIDTPALKFNRPGLPAIGYRVGTHSDFKATLLARMSSADYPALKALTTRNDDDTTIALCDSFAVLADVLTFYQERIANESYLRTALERRSVLQLARLIGYQLAPGVAAGTSLAFMLQDAPGAPELAAQPVTIPAGTRVQSVPDPGQDAQTFETVAPITGRVEWNAIPVQVSEPIVIEEGLSELFIAGANLQIQPGNAIAIIHIDRDQDATSDHWSLRWIESVDTDNARNVTRIGWSPGLEPKWQAATSAKGVHVHVFRQQASLFGHNAPDPRLLKPDPALVDPADTAVWLGYRINAATRRIDLDATYPKIVHNSWAALTGIYELPHAKFFLLSLHRVEAVSQLSLSNFGLSGKVTRVQLEQNSGDLINYSLRSTQVLAQDEKLTLAERPLTYPLYGSKLILGRREPDLTPGQAIAVSGKRQRIVIGIDTNGTFLNGTKRMIRSGETFVLLATPRQDGQPLASDQFDPPRFPNGWVALPVEDTDGATMFIFVPVEALRPQPALKEDKVVSEVCAIATGADAVQSERDRTTLTLQAPLAYCYDRATVAINANVAPATHGETVGEIAGSGDAGRPNQSFQLKQSLLTYVSTSDASGRAATVQARVNDLLWREVPTLYGHGRLERVYSLRQADDGKTTIEFGDGVEGARLPSGQNNVRLSYRKGIGGAGNLRASQLTMLLTRPLGVKSVTNPVASTGGQDPETLSGARTNAPLRVLTLDRAVSVQDYVDFSRIFPGVAKAYGIWIGDGRARGIHLTVAGPGGAAIPAGSDTLTNLVAALRRYGDPLLPLSARSYVAATFRLKAAVKVADDADSGKVLAAVAGALRGAYGFEAREFGQPVTIDEVYATIQDVSGVVAADILLLYRSDTISAAPPGPQPRLLAALPVVQADGSVSPAELLTLNSTPPDLGVMA